MHRDLRGAGKPSNPFTHPTPSVAAKPPKPRFILVNNTSSFRSYVFVLTGSGYLGGPGNAVRRFLEPNMSMPSPEPRVRTATQFSLHNMPGGETSELRLRGRQIEA